MASAGNAEQPVGLDHLETLVHQGRRVDGYFPAHLPGGMAQRRVGAHGIEVCQGQVAEGTARRREDEAAHLVHRPPVQALMDGVVFTVHWENGHSASPGRRRDQFPGHDQHFLVGQGDPFSRVDGGHHRLESGRARRRTQHDVGRGMACDRDQTVAACEHGAWECRTCGAETVGGLPRRQGNDRRAKSLRLFRQPLGVVAGSQPDHLQTIGMRLDDRERAAADRTGGSEDGQALQMPPRT